jgi:hypothetical protein
MVLPICTRNKLVDDSFWIVPYVAEQTPILSTTLSRYYKYLNFIMNVLLSYGCLITMLN